MLTLSFKYIESCKCGNSKLITKYKVFCYGVNYNMLVFFKNSMFVGWKTCNYQDFGTKHLNKNLVLFKPGPYKGLVSTFSQCMQCAFCLTFLWGQAVMPMGLATTPRGSARHAQRKSGRLEENKPLSRKGWKLTTFDTLSVFLRAIYSTTLKYGGAYCSDGVSATNIL